MKRRSFASSQPHEFHGINVTPMIDVVMCLIIFFLVVSSLAATEQARINLPSSAEGEEAKAPDSVTINIYPPTTGMSTEELAKTRMEWPARVTAEDRDFGTARDLETFVRTRLAANPECAVEIRADRALPYGWVEPAILAVARAGAPAARLAAEKSR